MDLAGVIDELFEAAEAGDVLDGDQITIQRWKRGEQEWVEWYRGFPEAGARCPHCGELLRGSETLMGMWELHWPHVDRMVPVD